MNLNLNIIIKKLEEWFNGLDRKTNKYKNEVYLVDISYLVLFILIQSFHLKHQNIKFNVTLFFINSKNL